MTTSYEPHMLIVLPKVGTHQVDQRVADYILQLAARNAKLERVAEAAQDYVTRHREGDTTYEAWGKLRDALDALNGPVA
jgi:hypothetical protein